MLSLTNKRILLGITGGIAAYKSAELTRTLVKAGAEVRIAMTPAATEFITPLTMQALSGNRVHLGLLDSETEAAMGHIELARWADLVVIAPATADFIARMAHAQADDLLTTLVLASVAPIAVAPAMNQAMWGDTGTQANLELLRQRGVHVWGPGSGEQACGDVGLGRMIEPDEIATHCASMFEASKLAGKRFLITGGPTREAIDPVRFISNHSSGKMAYALAAEAAAEGAKVTLVSGPVQLSTPESVERIDVESAEEMYAAVMAAVASADVFIGVAAVADYRPTAVANEKIKKTEAEMVIKLVKNPDIISSVSEHSARPFVAGFAAETENVVANGQEKLERKGLDLLFANHATDTFNSDSVAVTALTKDGQQELGPGNKHTVARAMLSLIAEQLKAISKGHAG
ncbi:MAG TPA: bifunctional phosphopantothenoylcysteine decarboxylase/phosphopantothenate--cysteine ligase CoaBC [Gammaproteobacteria bacterium]|uniref:Coenzyme A biosynthesis bifunctional protein CoaBC n=1 Tax=OM182 bacterium TaxID=2510334 RepID=A0A520S748_9GAMM|nr:MAG: bifunctional phosphopantothenoylcysteine decarboxylase/phosphopantothenate--cysteine ligase CoaBC [OM182 bacterium]HAO88975.1 bifunctional phosphopantothenoylcysteine decarboxylase/phosphopantothenate--cysteine ligase CoaBC [Gammaproteobacteria bacterium]HAR90687.1 bifunctional phosphopantothenoylcysteine decarboxylase/phosphopantothenate--cysteine ligase CoaBC [Gammaproteobacteria bacterium]HAU25286.1 bifunctional phosphopantothenoylcysteine decarboxylase/phosphopantothenate--cysteine l|tara:strand:+ start:781 stop:1989 length:1209 start_codon:yes stop_codon:yes gene_type:complete